LTENIFVKNYFPETILRQKLFYTETTGVLVLTNCTFLWHSV
jgi:hypothetical protein